jgi:hypothetical protein
MFFPITFQFRTLCNGCGGSIQAQEQGERDGGKKLNHCRKCTAIRARKKHERINILMKVE